MKVAQRFLMICGLFCLLVPSFLFLLQERTEGYAEKYDTAYIERFVSKICRTGHVTHEEYVLMSRALNHSGEQWEFTISEYQREQDLEGNGYYVLIAWEEIKSCLAEENVYYFAEDGVVKLQVRRWDKEKEKRILRFGRIRKGDQL